MEKTKFETTSCLLRCKKMILPFFSLKKKRNAESNLVLGVRNKKQMSFFIYFILVDI